MSQIEKSPQSFQDLKKSLADIRTRVTVPELTDALDVISDKIDGSLVQSEVDDLNKYISGLKLRRAIVQHYIDQPAAYAPKENKLGQSVMVPESLIISYRTNLLMQGPSVIRLFNSAISYLEELKQEKESALELESKEKTAWEKLDEGIKKSLEGVQSSKKRLEDLLETDSPVSDLLESIKSIKGDVDFLRYYLETFQTYIQNPTSVNPTPSPEDVNKTRIVFLELLKTVNNFDSDLSITIDRILKKDFRESSSKTEFDGFRAKVLADFQSNGSAFEISVQNYTELLRLKKKAKDTFSKIAQEFRAADLLNTKDSDNFISFLESELSVADISERLFLQWEKFFEPKFNTLHSKYSNFLSTPDQITDEVLSDFSKEVSIFNSDQLINFDTNEGKQTAKLNEWKSKIAILESQLRKAKEDYDFEQTETSDLLSQIDELLSDVSSRSLPVEKENGFIVEEAFEPILEHISRIRKRNLSSEERDVLKAKEQEVLKRKFDIYWKNYDRLIDFIEGKNTLGLEKKETIEVYILPNMEKIAAQIEDLNFARELKELKKTFGAIKVLNFGWQKMQKHVITEERRSIPESVSSENDLMMTGKEVHTLINEGMIEYQGGTVMNRILGKRKVKRLLRVSDYKDENGNSVTPAIQIEPLTGQRFVESEFTETAMGFCMRFYDALYRGDLQLFDSNGDEITVLNIHSKLSIVVDYAYKAVNRIFDPSLDTSVKGWEENATIPRSAAERALRLSSFVTLHQSDLSAKQSTGTSDPWYYMMHWHEYSDKYFKDKKANFAEFITRFFVGPKGYNPLDLISTNYKDSVKDAVKRDTSQFDSTKQSQMKSELGFSTFNWLANLPLISPRDVAIGYRGTGTDREGRYEARTFENPLSLLTTAERFADEHGVPQRVMTFDDYRVYGEYTSGLRLNKYGEIVDSSGNQVSLLQGDAYVYEEMPFDQIETKFVYEYVIKLLSGPYPFYKEVLSADQSKVVSSMFNPDYVKNLRKTVGYILPQLGIVGVLSREKPEISKAVQNQIIDVLIFAALLIKTTEKTKLDERWDSRKVYDNLRVLYENDAISLEELLVLYHATVAGRKMEIFMNGVNQTLNKQLESFFKFQS